MSESAGGYVTDAGYAETFFRELSPTWLNYVAASNAVPPRDLSRAFSYLELGCGFAGSTIVNAGAFPHAEFHACDLNAIHIDGARDHARDLGVENVHFHACGFERLPLRDMPRFDFIVMHGVYSWVNRAARDEALRIVRELLQPHGLVYVSYNCWPGWSVEAPLRKLLLEFAASSDGDTRERVEHAVTELGRLQTGRLRYFASHPELGAVLETYRKSGSSYLAHEFFNETWEPFYSIDVHDEMAAAGLSYVASATLTDNHAVLLIDDATARTIASLSNARQQQLAMDLAVDRRFRRDVFVRGTERLDREEAARCIGMQPIGCAVDLGDLSVKVRVPRGDISFRPAFIDELRDLVADGATTMAAAVSALGGDDRNAAEIARNLTLLIATGSLTPHAQTFVAPRGALHRKPANPTVAQALARAVEQRSDCAVPSQVLGNGVCIGPLEALGLKQWLAGVDGVELLAARLRSATDLLDVQAQGAARLRDLSHPTAVHVIEKLVPTFVRLGLIV